ncbi:hypothetical protein [Flaviaesturariibacter amylovorans]|uniref:hypothetical protein n=1 Tax=Flaviaesturariibacter amylovorans TaxID=1084520 RepID=UPI0031EDAAC9
MPTQEGIEMTGPEPWEGSLEKIERDKKKLVLFESMSAEESFRAMRAFVESFGSVKLRAGLQEALENPKPFKNFRAIINQASAVRERRFAHWQQASLQCVNRQWETLL